MKLSGNYTERYTQEEWASLIKELKGAPSFKHKVKSSPGDIQKNVYAIYKDISDNEYNISYIEKICIVTVEDKIHIEIMATNTFSDEQEIKDPYVKAFVKCLFEDALDEMPLYINDKDEVLKRICNWRLRNGK